MGGEAEEAAPVRRNGLGGCSAGGGHRAEVPELRAAGVDAAFDAGQEGESGGEVRGVFKIPDVSDPTSRQFSEYAPIFYIPRLGDMLPSHHQYIVF